MNTEKSPSRFENDIITKSLDTNLWDISSSVLVFILAKMLVNPSSLKIPKISSKEKRDSNWHCSTYTS